MSDINTNTDTNTNVNAATATPTPATSAAIDPQPFRRSTRQFNLGNGHRLVDMTRSGGALEIICEAPDVHFENVPTMSQAEAIRAALDRGNLADSERLAIIRQIVDAPEAADPTAQPFTR